MYNNEAKIGPLAIASVLTINSFIVETAKQQGWKRVFLERNMEELLMSITYETPPQELLDELQPVCQVRKSYFQKKAKKKR